jgi:hypothetical protein
MEIDEIDNGGEHYDYQNEDNETRAQVETEAAVSKNGLLVAEQEPYDVIHCLRPDIIHARIWALARPETMGVSSRDPVAGWLTTVGASLRGRPFCANIPSLVKTDLIESC